MEVSPLTFPPSKVKVISKTYEPAIRADREHESYWLFGIVTDTCAGLWTFTSWGKHFILMYTCYKESYQAFCFFWFQTLLKLSLVY